MDRLITSAELGWHFISSHMRRQDIVSPDEALVNEHASDLHLTSIFINDFSEELKITADELMVYIKAS